MEVAAGGRKRQASSPTSPASSRDSSEAPPSCSNESHDSSDSHAVPSLRARRAPVCLECRKGKVKCDLRVPCMRCRRMNLPCTPSPPSRRGLPGEPHPKRLRADAVKSTKYEGIMINQLTDDSSAQPSASSVHLGSLSVVREWLAVAAKRRSCEIMAKAFSLAAQSNIPLDEVLDPIHAHEPTESTCSVSFFCPLMRLPPTSTFVVGAPIKAHEVPMEMLKEVGCSSFEDGWTLVHIQKMGQKRIGVSSQFAKNAISWDGLAERYRQCNAHESTPGDLMEVLYPKCEGPKLYAFFGSMIKAYNDKPPPPQSCVTKLNGANGKPIEVEMFLSMRASREFHIAVARYVPIPKKRGKRANTAPASATPTPLRVSQPSHPPSLHAMPGARATGPQPVGVAGHRESDGDRLRDIGELLDSFLTAHAPCVDDCHHAAPFS